MRLARLPVSFEENRGQTDPRVKFLSHGVGGILFLTPDESVLEFNRTIASGKRARHDATPGEAAVVRIRLEGSRPNPRIYGLDRIAATSNYFSGSNPGHWQTGLPHYARVEYEGVYPGIDLVYRAGAEGRLEFDFQVAPGGDPAAIALRFSGADRLERHARRWPESSHRGGRSH